MKNEKLMRAMGEIDEDLILEAREAIKPRRHWVRWTALAACLALLVMYSPIIWINLQGAGGADMEAESPNEEYDNTKNDTHFSAEDRDEVINMPETDAVEDGSFAERDDTDSVGEVEKPVEAEPPEGDETVGETTGDGGAETEFYAVGATVRSGEDALVYVAATETSVSFHIKKTTDYPNAFAMNVFKGGQVMTLYSDGNGTEYLAIFVNGERTDAMPSEAGSYDITIDFSAALAEGWRVGKWLDIKDFGVFALGSGE